MSQLPQRRKTSEEIAHLRESLGIPEVPVSPLPQAPAVGVPPAQAIAPVATTMPVMAPMAFSAPIVPGELLDAKVVRVGPDVTPDETSEAMEATPVLGGERWVHSLKKSEQGAIPMHTHPQEYSPTGRWVHSLKKSEQGPVVVPVIKPSDGDSKIPVARHSDQELMEMKRRSLMNTHPPVPYLRSITAHPALLGLGYLLALAGGVGGMLVALFIVFRKRRSLHHAGFMTAIATLVLIFSAVQFPALIELWINWFPRYSPL